MAKIRVLNCDINSEDIIVGALLGAGVAFVALGIKSLFDARRIRLEQEAPMDEQDELDEFEEYLLEKEEKAYARMRRCVKRGIFGITAGSLVAAVAALALTPYKKIILESDAVASIKNADVINRIKEADVIEKIKSVDVNIKDTLKNIKKLESNIDNLASITDTIEKVKERLA
ncbi:MAG: hypothetical protein IKS48_13120 [Eubacterium sp.]|nr:hypothetical protein [Eubacterium sp.]